MHAFPCSGKRWQSQLEFTLIDILIVVGVALALITGSIALVAACKSAIARSTTGDFLDNVWGGISGNLWAAIALILLILPVYSIISIIITVRLLGGANGGITKKHIRGSVAAACISAAVGVPIYLLLPKDASIWWSVGLASVIIGCAIIGLTHPGWKSKPDLSNRNLEDLASIAIGTTGSTRKSDAQQSFIKEPLCYLCGKPLKADEFARRVCDACRM